MEQNQAKAYMVNTGWNGTGKRISIKDTRAIIDAILDGSIENADTKLVPIFNLEVPTALHDVNSAILDQEILMKTLLIGILKRKI